MASSEQGLKKLKQTPEDAPATRPESGALHQEFSELGEAYCDGKIGDALCLFIQAHLCIFRSMAGSSFPHMVALNEPFALKFVTVFKKFLAGDEFEDGPRLWIDALLFYRTRPTKVVRTLALMAKAHILEDLPFSLFQLEHSTGIEIEEAQYLAALDGIIFCLKTLDTDIAVAGESLEDALISTLAMHFGIVRKIRAVRVRHLRTAAWDAYRRHRSFAIGQRQKRQEHQAPTPSEPSPS